MRGETLWAFRSGSATRSRPWSRDLWRRRARSRKQQSGALAVRVVRRKCSRIRRRASQRQASSARADRRAAGTLQSIDVGLEGALGLESQLLQRALSALRRDRDPSAPLALLDQHAAEFPRGALGLEASIARIDALLALDRRPEALRVLDRLPLDGVGRRTEVAVVRAELRAEHDCARAVRDFDAALSLPRAAPLRERALFGRAGCRFQVGNELGARTDLDAYLEAFPHGRFAAAARGRLSAS